MGGDLCSWSPPTQLSPPTISITHKAAATVLGCGCWWWRACVWSWCCTTWTSAWSSAPGAVVTPRWQGLPASMAVLLWRWNTGICWALSPRANSHISDWIYPAAMGRVIWHLSFWQSCNPRHFQGPWLRGLFATSSGNRNFRLLIHYKTNRHSLHLVFIRRLDMAWGMQIPCDEEKKIPGLWRCKRWQIRQHYGIMLDLFANWGTTAVKHVSILGAEEQKALLSHI